MKEFQPGQVKFLRNAQEGQGISRKTVVRAAKGAAVGAVVGGADNYLKQRLELIKELPKPEGPKAALAREAVIFQRVDKKEVVKEGGKGALAGGVREFFRREPQNVYSVNIFREAA